MFAAFIIAAAAFAGSSCAMPAPEAAVTTTVTVIHSTTEPWPHVCPTTVATSTRTFTFPIATTTTTEPVTTSTQTYACFNQGCGPTAFPDLTPIATATAAPKVEGVEARALTTITQTHIYMEPTCVEYRSQTKIEDTSVTNPTSTATATTYAITQTATAIMEYCNSGWTVCPGSPYLVEKRD